MVLEKINKHEIKKIFQLGSGLQGSFPAASRVRDLGTLGSREGDEKELQTIRSERVLKFAPHLIPSYLFLLFLDTNMPFFSPSPELLAIVATFTEGGGLSNLRVVLELYEGKREIIVTSPFILIL